MQMTGGRASARVAVGRGMTANFLNFSTNFTKSCHFWPTPCSNPKQFLPLQEFFKFGRKPTMVKSRGAEAESVNAPGTSGSIEASVSTHPGTSSMGTHLRYRKSGGSGMGGGGRNSMAKDADRRKSLGAAASAAAAAGAGTPMDQGGGAGTPTGSTAGGGGRLSSAALVRAGRKIIMVKWFRK